MKRYTLFLYIILLLLFPAYSFAQESVPVRGSVRDGYSRVVLGLKDAASYTLDQSEKGMLVITLDRAANVDLSELDLPALSNIADVTLRSSDPFTLAVKIPKSSDVRDLKIGRRIILDVYDPANQADALDKSTVSTQPNTETKVADQKTQPVKAPAKDVEKAVSPPAAPPSIVLVPEHLPEREVPQAKKTEEKVPAKTAKKIKEHKPEQHDIRKDIEQKLHVLGLRTTSSTYASVFVTRNNLYFALQGDSPFLIPNLSSPTPEIFSDLIPVSADRATLYKIRLPEQHLNMKGQDGGLAWTLVMGDDVKEDKPPQPNFKKDASGRHVVYFPLNYVGDIIDIIDPDSGEQIYVAMVEDATQFAGDAIDFPEFELLRSPIGLAVRSKVDDLVVERVTGGVEIYRRTASLALASMQDISAAKLHQQQANKKLPKSMEQAKARHEALHGEHNEDSGHGSDHGHSAPKRSDGNAFFKFNEWALGPDIDLQKNEATLLQGLHEKSPSRQIEDLIALGKMFMAHGYAAEALGYFEFARAELPKLEDSVEFRALRGVARALDWKSEPALDDLLISGLDENDEIKYWKSFVLADLGDWRQAADVLPDHYKPIYNYPDHISNRLALVLAEVNLRNGNVRNADELISMVESRSKNLTAPFKAYLKYLKGEAYRQKGKTDQTEKAWTLLTEDVDDLYRTKAGLALTILLRDNHKINNKQAIDRLERLRYSWRGDELESQVNYWLGQVYFDSKQYIKGLNLMRDAASIAVDGTFSKRVAHDMKETFIDLYLSDGIKDVSPLDAVTLYEQFSELTPVGERGDQLVQRLAERLVSADLLDRATELLEHQFNHRLEGEDKIKVGLRLAAIHLLDKKPQEAMNALGKSQITINGLPDKEDRLEYQEQISLLKIRAYAQNEQFDKALSMLEKVPQSMDAQRLRADIAWQAGYWDDAAESLDAVIVDYEIKPDDKLTQVQADIILNRAISLSLADDRIALLNLRQKYLSQMRDTYKAHQFEVITRPRGTSVLADRETLLSAVSEVDLFKDFLDSYRNNTLHQ